MLVPVEGTTLLIKKEIDGGRVVCVCTTCGCTDIYNKKYMIDNQQECKECKRRKREEVGEDNKRVERLKQQEKNRIAGLSGYLKKGKEYINTVNSIKSIPLGKTIKSKGEVEDYEVQVAGYIGKFGDMGRRLPPTEVVFRCLRCGNIETELLKDAVKMTGRGCKVCVRSQRRIAESSKRVQEEQLKEQRKKDMIQQRIETKKEQAKEEKERTKNDEKMQSLKDKFPTYSPYIRSGNNGQETILICDLCGTPTKITDSKKIECKGCKKADVDENYKGLFELNHVGKVFNRIRITKQYEKDGNKICDCECLGCKKVLKEQPLYEALYRNISCNCDKSCIDMVCDKCGMLVSIRIAEITSKSKQDFICNGCGNKIFIREAEMELMADDVKTTMLMKAKELCSKLSYKETEIIPVLSIIKERNALYVGTNGEEYFRCACIEHNAQMTLSSEEIEGFDHSECNDNKQHLFNDLNESNIKLE